MDVYKLNAILGIDKSKYTEGMNEASKEADGLASKLGKLGSGLGKGLVKAAEYGTAAMITAGTATAALSKKSVEAYADYEQLVGGVETLFGAQGMSVEEYAESVGKSVSEVKAEYEKLEKAQAKVMTDAAAAYQTAGLSANEYMETVTGFAASLISSLGGDTDTAASIANQAIIDMADNANKMGSDLSSIQTAYAGFSKQNYTMLDNLKLGYGGTKQEMERLLEDAEKLHKANFGVDVDYNIESYADIINAIHDVQYEMGIFNATEEEASTTISGSLAAAKKAWENLVVGFSDNNADLDVLIGQFVDSVSQFGANLMPVVEKSLEGIAKGIEKIAPVIGQFLPKMVTKFAPMLINSGKKIILSLLKGIKDNIKTVTKSAGEILGTLVDALVEMIPMLADIGFQLVNGLVGFIADNGDMLIEQAINMIVLLSDTFVNNIDVFIENAIKLIETLVVAFAENADKLVDAAITIILALAGGLLDHLPELLDAAVKIVVALVGALIKNAPKLLEGAVLFIATLVEGIRDHLGDMVVAAAEIIGALLGGIRDLWEQIGELGARVIMWFVEGLASMYNLLTEYGDDLWDTISEFFDDIIDDALTWGKDLIGNMIDGMTSRISDIGKAASMIGEEIADFLGFSEPEEGPLSKFHTFAPDMIDLFTQGMYDNLNKITDATKVVAGTISGGIEGAKDMNAAPSLAMAGGGDIVIPVYIGQEKIDEVIITSEQVRNYRSGGR